MSADATLLLRDAVKHKGIGPKGSKKLPPELLQNVLPLLSRSDINSVTAAAFWTAFLLLDKSEDEIKLSRPILENPQKFLSPELQALTSGSDFTEPQDFLTLLLKVIQKQDLNLSETKEAMRFFWEDSTPSWMQASFLQGERVKRESFTENFVIFNDLWQRSNRVTVNLPHLIDLCDSYDGTNRSHHFTPFVAAILGALGFPTIIHGVNTLGPKYGVTNAQILDQAGQPTNLTLEQAKANLINPKIGWSYIDQSVYFPDLYALQSLRHDIVKRPFLATFEKLMQPIHNQKGNIVMTGYVHPHYREEIVKILSIHNQSEMVFNLRTIEGSTNCWGKKLTPFIGFRAMNGETTPNNQKRGLDVDESLVLDETLPFESILAAQGHQKVDGKIDPAHFGTQCNEQEIVKGITCEEITQLGLAALHGEPGLAQELLVFQSAITLWLSNLVADEKEAVDKVRSVILSGEAWEHWENQKSMNY